MTLPDTNDALARLLLAALTDGPVTLEPAPGNPGHSPADGIIRVDTNADPDNQLTAIRDALTDFLVAELGGVGAFPGVGEDLPTPRERMRLLTGGAR